MLGKPSKTYLKKPHGKKQSEGRREVKAEEEKRKRQHEEELKFEETKMQIKRDFEKNMEEERNKSVKESGVKLPKLTITKLQGTHLDWLRF